MLFYIIMFITLCSKITSGFHCPSPLFVPRSRAQYPSTHRRFELLQVSSKTVVSKAKPDCLINMIVPAVLGGGATLLVMKFGTYLFLGILITGISRVINEKKEKKNGVVVKKDIIETTLVDEVAENVIEEVVEEQEIDEEVRFNRLLSSFDEEDKEKLKKKRRVYSAKTNQENIEDVNIRMERWKKKQPYIVSKLEKIHHQLISHSADINAAKSRVGDIKGEAMMLNSEIEKRIVYLNRVLINSNLQPSVLGERELNQHF